MSDPDRPRVVLLSGRDPLSNGVYHALCEVSGVVAVIRERPPSKLRMVRRRMKRLGVLPVIDQLLFITLIGRFPGRVARRRITEILDGSNVNVGAVPDTLVRDVESINAPDVIDRLRAADPDVVVVNGTRIIARPVLESVRAPFINTHVGVTPAYRGVHGGYWALAEGKPELAGVTVHYIDTGIDTGGVIAQARIEPGPRDSFHTYPALQLARALPLLKKAVLDTHRHGVRTVTPLSNTSRLYYHPGLSQYLIRRVRDGVR